MTPHIYGKLDSESSHDDTVEQQPFCQGPGQFATWRRASEILQLLRWPLNFLLLIGILLCEISILHRQPSFVQIGGELNGLVPNFSKEQKLFRADDRYVSDHKTWTSINETKQQWHKLMPRGEGFLHVPDFASHMLPPPINFYGPSNQDIFAISVFHQLHCLTSISFALDELAMRIRDRNFTLDEEQLIHNDHCISYLRNALLCCGDTTLEGQAQSEMFKDTPGTDGTGAVHLCRNYDEITAWAEKHRADEGTPH